MFEFLPSIDDVFRGFVNIPKNLPTIDDVFKGAQQFIGKAAGDIDNIFKGVANVVTNPSIIINKVNEATDLATQGIGKAINNVFQKGVAPSVGSLYDNSLGKASRDLNLTVKNVGDNPLLGGALAGTGIGIGGIGIAMALITGFVLLKL